MCVVHCHCRPGMHPAKLGRARKRRDASMPILLLKDLFIFCIVLQTLLPGTRIVTDAFGVVPPGRTPCFDDEPGLQVATKRAHASCAQALKYHICSSNYAMSRKYCKQTCSLCDDHGIPTSKPSSSPTRQPTNAPTRGPSPAHACASVDDGPAMKTSTGELERVPGTHLII